MQLVARISPHFASVSVRFLRRQVAGFSRIFHLVFSCFERSHKYDKVKDFSTLCDTTLSRKWILFSEDVELSILLRIYLSRAMCSMYLIFSQNKLLEN